MSTTIRAMVKEDKNCVLDMMRIFYTSPAVWSNGSEEIYNSDIDNWNWCSRRCWCRWFGHSDYRIG